MKVGTKIEINLKYPIEYESEGVPITVSKIVLTRLKIKHLKALPKSFYEADGTMAGADAIPFLASWTGLKESVVEELDLEDLTTIMEKVGSFLESSQGTGKKPSGN